MKKSNHSQNKVIEGFKSKGIEIEILNLEQSTKTSVEASEAVGCKLEQIAKSIIFKDINNNFVYRQHFPALTMNPVDVAGAGDSLLASIAVGLSQGLTLMESSALGCCVAALAVQSMGNAPVDYHAVKNFINQQGLALHAI